MLNKNYNRGFTLVELLVVVAIISILATIAVPNFLDAQVRAKVSRVMADMSSLAVSLEAYAVDNTSYPPRHHPNPNATNWMPIYSKKLEEMSRLTTPIGYITRIPEDVFLLNLIGYPEAVIEYMDGIQARVFLGNALWLAPGQPEPDFDNACARFNNVSWLLLSVGPDKCIGVAESGQPGNYPRQPKLYRNSFKYLYDPHNGSVSKGNIIRLSTTADQDKIADMMGYPEAKWGENAN